MGVFEKLPYLNYHDINLDWLVKQTKKNASDNSFLMKIFKWFNDQGLVGVVTEITENPDDTVKIDYADINTMTMDDFTVYNKTGADNAILGAQSAAESYADGVAGTAETNAKNYADTAIGNAFKGLSSLPTETNLQNTDLLLINRSGAAKAIAGSVVAKQSDMTNALNDISTLQNDVSALETGKPNIIKLSAVGNYTIDTGGAYEAFIVYGLYSGTRIFHLFVGGGNTILNVVKIAGTGVDITFTNVANNRYEFTIPSATNISIIGLYPKVV